MLPVSWLNCLRDRLAVSRKSNWGRVGNRRRSRTEEISLLAETLEVRALLTPSVSLQDLSFQEGNIHENQTHTLQVNLSETATEDIYVYFAWADGTATAAGPEADYSGTDGAVRIPAGFSSIGVGVYSWGDVTAEPNEYFYVRISSVYGATISDGEAVVTIRTARE